MIRLDVGEEHWKMGKSPRQSVFVVFPDSYGVKAPILT
jgi:hypothetical protein